MLHAAIDGAFREIAHLHARMSFQSPESDLSAIGRLREGESRAIDPSTAACLEAALRLAADSGGAFDPVLPENGARWRDLVLDGTSIHVRRPLRLDLSGIAKGFAVDRACDRLREAGVATGVVNAGGDLGLFGGDGETIALRPHDAAPPAAVRVADGALASSDVRGSWAEYDGPRHRDGRTGLPLAGGFVSVAAPLCRDADALTKVVLAMGGSARPLLASRDAIAYVLDPEAGWWSVGGEP